MYDFFCAACLNRVMDQGIAHTRNRQDIAGLVGIGLHFLTHVADMRLD
jgi:hypothetical protein